MTSDVLKGHCSTFLRGAVLGAVVLAVACTLGCRKSRTEQERERHEDLDALQESEIRRQEAVAANRREYEEGKLLIAERRYDEAWAKFEKAAAADENIALEFTIYKAESLPSRLFRLADELSKIKSYQFNAASRRRVQQNFNEAYRTLVFVRDHIEKKRATAEKKIDYLKRLKAADDRYYAGLNLIENYERVRGIALIEEVRDNYKDTPYYDLAIAKLVELDTTDDRPGH